MAWFDLNGDGENDLIGFFKDIFDFNGDGDVDLEDLKDYINELLKGEDGVFEADDLLRIIAKIQLYINLKK